MNDSTSPEEQCVQHYHLKQQHVTYRDPQLLKRNLMMHVNVSHQTAVLVKLVHILQRKCPLVSL